MIARAAVAAVLALPAGAQAVTPITTTAIDAFVLAAAPGDVLWLQGGVHTLGVPIDKGITLLGPAVLRPAPSQAELVDVAVPAGQRARFVDLAFADTAPTTGGPNAVTLRLVDSSVSFERCACNGSTAWAGLSIQRGDVVLDGCDFVVMACAAVDANVQIRSSTLTGRDSRPLTIGTTTWQVPGTSGFLANGGTVQISDSTLVGGPGHAPSAGANPTYRGQPGLELVESIAWVTDSTLLGNGAGAAPGSPAVVGSTCHHARTSLTGGPGSPPGPAAIGLVQLDPLLLGSRENTPLALGAQYSMTVTADQPNVPIAIAVTPDVLTTTAVQGVLAQPLWHGSATPDVVATGVTGPANEFVLTFVVPSTPALRFASLSLMGVRIASLPLQLSPLCGGLIR